MENQNRKRSIQMPIRVTEDERDLIFLKMEQLQTNNFAAYARKILIDGYMIFVDYSDLKAVCAEMQEISRNIYSIAKRVNETSRFYEQDFHELRNSIADIHQMLRKAFRAYDIRKRRKPVKKSS
jgi:alpha/beta superfamily hydrolase